MATLLVTKDYLEKRYINSRYSAAVDDWPPYHPKHYTTLALIHHKDKYTDAAVLSVTQELAVAGKFQPNIEGLLSSDDGISQASNLYSNATKNISDIFVPFMANDKLTIEPCIILIEGAPGIGKTVLAKEIAFQWASNNLLSDKKVLFLLFLRQFDFKTITTIENFVEYVVRSSEMAACLVKHFKKQGNQGQDLAIIFDGYDEISKEDRANSIIADIIDREIFSKCCLVITSRPTASSHLHKKVDCRVEIVGFTEEDRLDYIQTALQSKNNEKVEALKEFLRLNPTINALCYIPLNMTILLCLAQDGIDHLPKTQTDMYKKFVEMTIMRFIHKINAKIDYEVITSINKLPYPYNKVFEELTKLAYSALTIDKIVFRLSEIKEVCPNLAAVSSNWNGLGLLKAVQHIGTKIGNVTFHFLHFSVQEYMAALYISSLSKNKQIRLLKETFWEYRYYNTWIMYVGITYGSSFALKHFLSGHLLQLFTRIFKTSVSRKILENKIKCLHLFQCLVESNNEDMIASVSHFFQGKQIDLSNQTLLPSDVNTLGFFLIRSINKQWEMLNLAGCNIGNTGINVLCDRLLNKESRDILTIKRIDFSYNQLNFSSLVQLFNLLKSLHVSELIIKKIVLKGNYDVLYKAIDDAFLSSYCENQVNLKLGSFVFSHKVDAFYEFTESVVSMYLLNCEFTRVEASNFKRQNLSEIHLINTSLSIHLMKKISDKVLNVFIYNSKLSDQDADEVCSSALSSGMANGIMLIISESKIQGAIKSSTISKQLTKLELFNLAANVHSNNMQTYPWKGNLHYDGSNNNFIQIDNIFIGLLRKIICNKVNWKLRIMLKEKGILIAHRINYESISGMCHSLKSIYLNACSIKSEEYEIIFCNNETLIKLCIFNSFIDQKWLTIMRNNSFSCKDMFIHTLCDINIEENLSCFSNNCSAVLVTKNKVLVCNSTIEQILLAFELEPSINVLDFLHCKSNQIIATLTASQSNISKVDFMNCHLEGIDYENLRDQIKVKSLSVDTLKISSEQLTEQLVPKCIPMIILWKTRQIVFYDIDHTVSECFKEKFRTTITNVSKKIFLSVTHNNKKDVYFSNFNWSQITQLLKNNEGASLFIINCCFPLQAENINIIKLCHISKLYIINSTLEEETIVNILETFMGRALEMSIYNTSKCIDYKLLFEFITNKRLVYENEISFVAVMKNFMCGCNTTEDQLHLLQSQKLNNIERTVVNLVSDTKQIHEKELFVFQNKQITTFYSVGKASQPKFIAKLVDVLKQISSLKSFGIDKYTISGNIIDDIVATIIHNEALEQLYLNSTMQTTDLLDIMKVLDKFTNLKILEIANSDITDQVTEYLTSIMSLNTQLHYFSITNGNVLNTNVIKISKAIRNTPNLQELTITGNSIVGITNIVATVDSKTRELNLGDYNKQTVCIKLIVNKVQSTLINNGSIATEDDAVSFNTQQQIDGDRKKYFQATDVIAITNALQSSFILKKLCIKNNNITKKDADIMAGMICTSKELQELDVCESSLNSADAIKILKALQNVSTLTKLYICNNKMTDNEVEDIAAVLSCNTQLQELNMNENQFQAVGIMAITKSLRYIKTLTKLYISNCNITDEAASSIAATIYSNAQLQEIDVSKSHLLSTGAIEIAKAMQTISTLTKLYINGNHITITAAHDIALAVSYNSDLQELDISENNFNTGGVIKIVVALRNNFSLKKLNISNNNITDEASADVAVIIRSNTQLQEFDFSKNKFELTGIVKIIEALQSVSTLIKLYFGNNHIRDGAAVKIATILYNNVKLQELDISNLWFQAASVMIISKVLQKIATLKKLYINNNDVTDEAANDIAAVLYQNTQLSEFSIRLTKLGHYGIACITKALCATKHLVKLKIEGIGVSITDEAAESIAAAVSSNNKLQIFDISKTSFGHHFTKITNALLSTSALTKLYISNNNITTESADSIAAVIFHSSKLQEFDVGKNNLQSTGAIKITKALQQTSILTKLSVNNNNIMDMAVDDIATVIYNNTQLDELNISENWFEASSIVKIAKAIQSAYNFKKLYINNSYITDGAANDIAAALACNTQLEVLDISGNHFETPGIIKIAKALQKISTLEQLYINNNKITDGALDDIAAICSYNTQLQVLHFYNKNLFTFKKASEMCAHCKKLLKSNVDIDDSIFDC